VETPNTAGGVYIPPSMRNKTASSAGGSSTAGSRTKSGWVKTHCRINHCFSFVHNLLKETKYLFLFYRQER